MSFLKAMWKGNLKHKKLYEESAEDFECEPITESSMEEVMFRVKYLGSTLVEKAASEGDTAEAIKTILLMAKASGKKLQRVAVFLGLNGVKVVDVPTEEIHLNVSIYSVSYCSADAAHSQVFAFIATNSNETMECHAFLCRKRKTAQIMSLTLARVFHAAYDLLPDDFHEEKFIITGNGDDKSYEKDILRDQNPFDRAETTLLIDFNSDLHQNSFGSWECFDDEVDTNDLNYAKFWKENKTPESNAFESDFFGNNVCWEDVRTDLLCS